MGQIGATPRPAGLPLPHFAMKLRGEPLEPRVRSYQDGFCKLHKTKPKGLNQVKLGLNPVTNQRVKTQIDLRNIVYHVPTCQNDGGPSRARARPTGLGEAGRPLTVSVEDKQLSPTFGRNQERPREGSGRSEATLGRPAPLVSL